MRRDTKLLLGVVALGLALRLVGAGARLSHDEGYSWLVATAPSADAFLARIARFENTPPGFYLTLVPLPLDSPFWLRLPSIVAGTLWIPVTAALGTRLLDRRAGLLAALAVAVAPFAVSYSDYSRGFMVCGLALLVCALAAVRRQAVLFVIAATVALYCEYYAAIFIVAFAVLGRRPWLVLPPALLFAPWLGQMHRGLDNLGQTKLDATPRFPTPGVVRDAVVPLVFGEHGSKLPTLQALAVAGVVAWALTRLDRRARLVLGGTLAIVLVGYVAAAAVATDLVRQRYLTALIPLGALVVAGALPRRATVPAAIVLVVLGAGIGARRAGREYEPDAPRAVALAHAPTILTNSAVIAFYGRHRHVILDRPFGLGPGRTCDGVCAVVDDARYGGVRPGSGPATAVGPILVRHIDSRGP